ncbi:MAG: hypothetical protein R3300_02810 [Candidatus Promineifilaceae bacterium]|nr:hypothetical protein [Candidatus Promineifilaceae bacterium]
MPTISHEIQEKRLLSYVVASSDMRYIEINARVIYLRHDPLVGPIVQGCVPECGPVSDVNLSEMLLEYAMSCEDCRDPATASRNIDHFGEILAGKLIAGLDEMIMPKSGPERLAQVMDIILNSMGVQFHRELTADSLQYELATCPLHKTATITSMKVWVAPAHSAFVALCNRIISALAPDFVLVQPAEARTETPLERILIARK